MSYSYGNEEEQSRKLFLGGISLDTTDQGLKDYFSKYGNITDCVVIRDQNSGRSKGFGFVTFETEKEADDCMNDRPHNLDSRQIDAKRAVSREESSKPGAHIQVKKVFIGGIRDGCDEYVLREYFQQFGTIVSCEIPRDKQTNQPKAFGFVTFDDYDVIDKLVAKRHHQINGHQCEVKKALSREEMEKAKQHMGSKPSRSGRGGSGGASSYNGDGDYGDRYGSYHTSANNGIYSGGGPMRGLHAQPQRSAGPYGSGYASGSYSRNGGGYASFVNYGSYGSNGGSYGLGRGIYGSGGGSYGLGRSGYGLGGVSYVADEENYGLGGNNIYNDEYGSYGGQVNNYYYNNSSRSGGKY